MPCIARIVIPHYPHHVTQRDNRRQRVFFNDEGLRGEWRVESGERRGYRSSRLNLQYRVIYKVERDEVLIQVVQLTPHDYKRN